MEELREKPVGGAIFMNQVINRAIPEGSNPTGGTSRTDSSPMSFTPESFASMEEVKILELGLLDEKDFRQIHPHNIFQGFFFQPAA